MPKLGSVETYKGMPAINVKHYGRFGSVDAVMQKFGCDKATAEQALENAYKCAVREFWETAEADALEIFGTHATVYSEGRMGGWLIVDGLGDASEWTTPEREKWGQFVDERESDIRYRASDDYIMDVIDANKWAPTPLEAAQHDVDVAQYALDCAQARLSALLLARPSCNACLSRETLVHGTAGSEDFRIECRNCGATMNEGGDILTQAPR